VQKMGSGPLAGVRVLEFAGLGPAPFCGMLLSDMGAEVLRIDRADAKSRIVEPRFDITARGKRAVALDLKSPRAVQVCLRLIERADILIEGFRPGVMERLGLGPDTALEANPRLVYGRMTGWGQEGPLAQTAGHDINYIALSGALHAIGPERRPVPPLNLVGDYGGGALYLAMGVLAALLSARQSGQGQVVDAAMSDGAVSLMSVFYGLRAAGLWSDRREANLLDGGAPFYGVFECVDGGWIALGPLEPQFYAELVQRLELDPALFETQHDRSRWPAMRAAVARAVAARSRQEWVTRLQGSDVCFAPVLSLDEAPRHPHHSARAAFVEMDGVIQPAPAPRFSHTPSDIQGPPPTPASDDRAALTAWGLDEGEIAELDGATAE
jgi:alpha-methylacyl-CoA racemase